MSANEHDWARLLNVAQFSYNLQRSEATRKSPFELGTGQQPLIPHTLSISFNSVRCPGVAKMAKSWAKHSNLAKSLLEKARRRVKKLANAKRRHLEFNIGDKNFEDSSDLSCEHAKAVPRGRGRSKLRRIAPSTSRDD
ncbi:hypothetical protein BUALT_Bualt17G0043800 [Buddleja alternifolia]|uniref:Uncharacterized protein n=1 Tax=Buddleja alternifolia TaxID=168488 RepID=A0AAV6WGP1_9LAMI|nr:hypothetical protein BUALT_Bualt17G0043800 [Buddleja alternifolia]